MFCSLRLLSEGGLVWPQELGSAGRKIVQKCLRTPRYAGGRRSFAFPFWPGCIALKCTQSHAYATWTLEAPEAMASLSVLQACDFQKRLRQIWEPRAIKEVASMLPLQGFTNFVGLRAKSTRIDLLNNAPSIILHST